MICVSALAPDPFQARLHRHAYASPLAQWTAPQGSNGAGGLWSSSTACSGGPLPPQHGGTITLMCLFPSSNVEAGSRVSLGVAGPASHWFHIMAIVKGWLGITSSMMLAVSTFDPVAHPCTHVSWVWLAVAQPASPWSQPPLPPSTAPCAWINPSEVLEPAWFAC